MVISAIEIRVFEDTELLKGREYASGGLEQASNISFILSTASFIND